MTAEPIERHWPKQWADEELTLQWGALQSQSLTFLRITAVNKIAELDPALAAAAPIKTSGRWWIRAAVAMGGGSRVRLAVKA